MSTDELALTLMQMLNAARPAPMDRQAGALSPKARKELLQRSPHFSRCQHPTREILTILSAFPFVISEGAAARVDVPDFLFKSVKDPKFLGDESVKLSMCIRVCTSAGMDLDLSEARIMFNRVPLPQPPRPSKCSASHGCLASRGVDLTPCLLRGKNELLVSWGGKGQKLSQDVGSASQTAFVALFLARQVSVQEIVSKISPVTPIKIEEGERIALRCPISQVRLITPVRGAACTHHACFDLGSILAQTTWHCPFCNHPLRLEDLRLDRKIQELAATTSAMTVISSAGGRFTPVENEPEEPRKTGAVSQSRPAGFPDLATADLARLLNSFKRG